jgi:hypothetical protein
MTYAAKAEYLIEAFPVQTHTISRLAGWEIHAPSGEKTALGNKLAHRFRILRQEACTYVADHLVVDKPITIAEWQSFLAELKEKETTFENVLKITQDKNFVVTPQVQAEFIAFGVSSLQEKKIREILDKDKRAIRNATVERDYSIQGYVVGGQPATAITLHSHIISPLAVSAYIKKHVKDLADIKGLDVRDKFGSLGGKIEEIMGPLEEYRAFLIEKATRPFMKEFIKKAAGDELVISVRVKSSDKPYLYVASALRLVASPSQYGILDIDGEQALAALQIQPARRYELVNKIAQLFVGLDYISATPFSSPQNPEQFITQTDTQLGIQARLGDGYTCACDARTVLSALKNHPPLRYPASLPKGQKLRIANLNLIGDREEAKTYIKGIREHLNSIGLSVSFTGSERVSEFKYRTLEEAIDKLIEVEEPPHIILAFTPGREQTGEGSDSLYLRIKSITAQKNMPNQIIYEQTLASDYAINNIVLGILAKVGVVPYVFNKPLPYADLFVGLDVSRKPRARGKGSLSTVAMTRIYAANGDFIKYHVAEGAMEGEIIPMSLIRKLLPAKDFEGKKCVIHRDGRFVGSEREDFYAWAKDIKATFYLVEVVKSHVPRMYKREVGAISRPDKGTVFIVNEQEAFVVSSLPPSKNSTPRPLHIRTDGQLSIRDAVHSILALTHLHIGSMAMPRLPITIHYSDIIAYLVGNDVRPLSNEGTNAFWI